jgi:hypothetical protein
LLVLVTVQRHRQQRYEPIVAQQEIINQVAGKSFIGWAFKWVFSPAQHDQHVNIRPGPGVTPGLGTKQDQVGQTRPVVCLEPLPQFRKK